MLGERSDHRGPWEADQLYLDLVGTSRKHCNQPSRFPLPSTPNHRKPETRTYIRVLYRRLSAPALWHRSH